MPLLIAALAVAGAYLLGGIPTGLLLGRWLKGIDLRQYGSGKTGATNAARTLGARISIVVFVLDALKGLVAVLLAHWLTGGNAWVEALAGVAAIAGHCWSPYIGFTGGRGVATGAGAALVIAPWAVLLAAPVGFLVAVTTRYMSLVSLFGAVSVPLAIALAALLGWLPPGTIVFGVLGGALIIIMHRDNIRRLLAGTERKIGERATSTK